MRITKSKGLLLIALGVVLAIPVSTWIYQTILFEGVYDAIQKGDATTVQRMMQRGANPNYVNWGLVGGTPLYLAAGKSNIKIVKVLIQAGADVNQKSNDGNTPLMNTDSPQIAQLLLNAGANPTIRNDDGLTAWQGAKYGGDTELAKVIMRAQNKLSVNSKQVANKN